MTPYLSSFFAFLLHLSRWYYCKNMTPYLSCFSDTVPVIFFNHFSASFSLSETYCLLSYFFTSFTLNSVRCCTGAPLPLSFLSSFRLVFFFWSVMTGIWPLFVCFIYGGLFLCVAVMIYRDHFLYNGVWWILRAWKEKGIWVWKRKVKRAQHVFTCRFHYFFLIKRERERSNLWWCKM